LFINKIYAEDIVRNIFGETATKTELNKFYEEYNMKIKQN
jgi:hypothetical protein